MKKAVKLTFLLIISIFTIGSVNAASSSETGMYKLTKEIIVTTGQVNKDFGENYTNVLDIYFTNIRYDNDRQAIENLNGVLEPLIIKYVEKGELNISERKTYNLFRNIYFRGRLISEYYIE